MFVFEILYSLHTFSRSSTSSSVQIKQSDLTLLVFCVFCQFFPCGGILQAIKRNICTWRQKILTLFDTNTNLPPKTRLIGHCACSVEQFWRGALHSRMNPDTCGRVIRFVSGHVWTRKLLNPERMSKYTLPLMFLSWPFRPLIVRCIVLRAMMQRT